MADNIVRMRPPDPAPPARPVYLGLSERLSRLRRAFLDWCRTDDGIDGRFSAWFEDWARRRNEVLRRLRRLEQQNRGTEPPRRTRTLLTIVGESDEDR